MQKIKILINGITLEGANIVPLLLKVKRWQERDVEVTFFGNKALKTQIDSLRIIKTYNFLKLNNTGRITGRMQLIVEGLRRNLSAISYLGELKNKFDVVYSISSVLDLMIFPYILKRFDKKILRVAVFDNIVPITDPGNRMIRFLAWIFFQISLLLLEEADQIFTGSTDLESFLISRGIDKNKIIERGQAVRNDMIRQAKANPKYDIDALFIGRINETKGIYDMLKVLEIVKVKYPDFQLALIGTGNESTMRRYKDTISRMGLGNNIQFLGYRTEEEKFNIIKSSRIFWFLSVSESESWGIALLEAVCSGKPAVVYNLPAFHFYKKGEVFFFKIHDYISVAAKVIDIFGKKDFDNPKGELLLGRYSWEKIAEIEYDNVKLEIQKREIPQNISPKILINGITLEGAN
ncbi:glycosyltransferase, partial [Candidatus Gottesmanbacteria bacterium]|nr:glycosyltransferase [Candidatus Gottesmanbacteria bacterium]